MPLAIDRIHILESNSQHGGIKYKSFGKELNTENPSFMGGISTILEEAQANSLMSVSHVTLQHEGTTFRQKAHPQENLYLADTFIGQPQNCKG